MVDPSGDIKGIGQGSYGRLGMGNSDDQAALVSITALQGNGDNAADRVSCRSDATSCFLP